MPDDRPTPRPTLTALPFRGWRFSDGLRQTYAPGDATQPEAVAPLPRMMRAVLAVDEADQPAAARGTGRVREQLRHWRDVGVLRQDPAPAFYAYRRSADDRQVVGLIAAISLHPPRDRVVVPHEGVDPVMVGRQATLMAAFDGQPEPVVTVHRGSPAFREVISGVMATRPVLCERTGDVLHELWRIAAVDPVACLRDELAGTTLLLADGHHRYAAFQVARARRRAATDGRAGGPMPPWDVGLAMLVDDGETGLQLGPIHRVIPAVSLARIEATPGVAVTDGRTGPCLLTDGARWWTLTPERIASHVAGARAPELLVSLLHREWLPSWQVTTSSVSYVHDAHTAVAQARAGGGLALLLPSPGLDAVFDAAASGQLMPAKATSFQPKPLIGMVMRHWPDGAGDL